MTEEMPCCHHSVAHATRSYFNRIGNLFCQEPYRVFFPLGILAGAIGASHWLFYALGWISHYSGLFHSSVQTKSYMFCFVIGFLLTAMPRFSGTQHATALELSSFLFVVLANIFLLLIGKWIGSELCFSILLILLARFAFVRFVKKEGNVKPPTEFAWIPVAVLHGLIGSALILLSHFQVGPIWLGKAGKAMSEQGFLLSIVVGVGGFLTPRLTGLFTLIKPSEIRTMSSEQTYRKERIQFHFLMGFILFVSFWLEGLSQMRAAYAIRAIVVTVELFLSKSLPRPPLVSTFFAWLLWISMWMVFAGSWAVVFLMNQRVALLHIVFIGGYALMTFAVGTMVTLSHGGEAARLQKPLWILWVVAIGIFFALTFRIASSFSAPHHFQLLGVAASCWLVVGFSWLCFVAPRIGRIPHEGEFERQHEEMKQRLQHPC